MGNLLQSSQNKTTTAPCYYNKYLCSLATKGEAAACKATYACASPLQTQAFQAGAANLGSSQPTFQNAQGLIGCAANQNITGAAAPYLNEAAGANTGQMAQCYMSPYLNSAVQNVENTGERNIQQNLAPQATASAVGSGQFGSQRGAQALGQVQSNAMACMNSNISNMENNAYKCAMSAAEQKQSLLGQLGSTAGTEATNQANVLNQAGANMASTGTQAEQANIRCLCAVSKLGAECQAIRQNASCFCLNKENKLAGVLQGAQIPTGVKTTMCMSPLSALGTGASIVGGIACKYGSCIAKGLSSIFSNCSSGKTTNCYVNNITPGHCVNNTPAGCYCYLKTGGLVNKKTGGAIGCASKMNYGGLPSRR